MRYANYKISEVAARVTACSSKINHSSSPIAARMLYLVSFGSHNYLLFMIS